MKQIPNIITIFRMIGSVALLLPKQFSTGFLLLYLLCGLSDVLDGYIARKPETAANSEQSLTVLQMLCLSVYF